MEDGGYEPGDLADPVRDLPTVRPGDRVRLRGIRGLGEVISVDAAGHDIEVLIGAMRMRTAPEEIESVESASPPPRRTGATARPLPIPSSGFLEADLHGLRVEAAAEVAGKPAIIPSIAGWARVTGFNTIFIDERDPFAHGFVVT